MVSAFYQSLIPLLQGQAAHTSGAAAWNALKTEGYPVAMVLVVRHGNGLYTRWSGSGSFFENFDATGDDRSSLIVMFGDA